MIRKQPGFTLLPRRKIPMSWSFVFFVNSILLGVGLAMDAFSVSLANGLQDPKMKRGKMAGIAGVFAGFQALMPMLGWICVHTVMQYFEAFEKFIPLHPNKENSKNIGNIHFFIFISIPPSFYCLNIITNFLYLF